MVGTGGGGDVEDSEAAGRVGGMRVVTRCAGGFS